MAKKSKIKRMPAEVRALIERLLREDRLSLDEMIAEVKAQFPDAEPPSRSGLHRYKEGFDQLTERMRSIETMANALVGELGEDAGEKAGALLAQSITTLAANAALQAHANDETSVEDVRKLARAAKDVLQARRISLTERRELEKAAEERLLKEQRARLDGVVKRRGMSADTADQIKREILGVT